MPTMRPESRILTYFQRDQISDKVLFIGVTIVTLFFIVVPRVVPLAVAASLFLIACLHLWSTRETLQVSGQDLKSLMLSPAVLFFAWALVACLWSAEPEAAVPKALFFGVLTFLTMLLARQVKQLDRRATRAISLGILAGFLLGALYLCLETWSRDVVFRTFLTYLPGLERGFPDHATLKDGVVTKVKGGHITRVAMVLTLFWSPALLAASLYMKGAKQWACYAAVVMLSVGILLLPYVHSQTAELALVIALLTVAVGLVFSVRVARWMAAAGFATCIFLMVPISFLLFSLKAHENPALFRSAKARVIIWNYTSEQIVRNPLGVGTNSTRFLDKARPAHEKRIPPGMVIAPGTHVHPHNVYLQIWYELGVVGAMIFAWLGFSLLSKTKDLPNRVALFAVSHFAICITVIGPTYGLWQTWFQTTIALSLVAFLAVANGHFMPPDRPTRDEAAPPDGGTA